MKKAGFFLAVGIFGLVLVSQFATGSNFLVDWLGGFIGWIRTTFYTAKNTVQDTVTMIPGVNQDNGATALDLALPIIAKFEGFVGHAYQDAVGVWTIGYGHKIIAGDGFRADKSQTISESDAWALMYVDAADKQLCIRAHCDVALTPPQEAALISFVFNEGCGAFQNSTMLDLINSNRFEEAAAQFPRWVYAGTPKTVLSALVSRRQQEMNLFLS